jgi:perosamine synthetase
MIKLWRLRQAAENQFRNLRTALSGSPVTFPSLGSMTLEHDDVEIARNWLKKDQRHWDEEDAVIEYQEEFCRWNGSKHAYAFMGGRVALSACIHALGLEAGDEVIMPGYTCVVVPNAFHFAGIRIVYCDIELETYGMDSSSLESAITPNTRAILIHHLYGLVCRDYEKLLEIAEREDIPVIEDCAQSTGATFQGIKVGNRGALSIYSSEQSKVLNTIQGGLAVTNDDDLGERLREYWENAPNLNHDIIDKLLHNVLLNFFGQKHPKRWLLKDVIQIKYGGKRLISTTIEEEHGNRPSYYGARMPAPIACLGLNQLGKLDRFNAERRETAKRWDEWCLKNGYQPAKVIKDSVPIFLRYPLLVEPEKKADRSWARRELGIILGVWFRSNIHPAKRTVINCPRADEAVAGCINFPTLLR